MSQTIFHSIKCLRQQSGSVTSWVKKMTCPRRRSSLRWTRCSERETSWSGRSLPGGGLHSHTHSVRSTNDQTDLCSDWDATQHGTLENCRTWQEREQTTLTCLRSVPTFLILCWPGLRPPVTWVKMDAESPIVQKWSQNIPSECCRLVLVTWFRAIEWWSSLPDTRPPQSWHFTLFL